MHILNAYFAPHHSHIEKEESNQTFSIVSQQWHPEKGLYWETTVEGFPTEEEALIFLKVKRLEVEFGQF